MTQRIHSPAQSGSPRRTLKARAQALQAAADAAPRSAMDRVWSAGYISISLLAIAAVFAIAAGETANAELRFATVAIRATPPAHETRCADVAGMRLLARACASAHAHKDDSSGGC